MLKLSPLVVVGHLSAFYERTLTDRLTVVLGYGIGGKNLDFGRSLDESSFTYQRATLEGRRYGHQRGLQGWYVGPYLRAGPLRASYFRADPPGPGTWQTEQAWLWHPGALVGHQLLTRWFVLDTFLGLHAKVIQGSLQSTNQFVEAMTQPGVGLRVGCSVGVPF
ncbi:hypothetical protein [Hymenobacter radiodurans]|uniref:hypothetical protein n=1 Tax=Hymenobacter radiodurans TaxID=2496028 RepID=UPI00105900A5|nr:hypothetical protein [Hymenobacter radiodurans]